MSLKTRSITQKQCADHPSSHDFDDQKRGAETPSHDEAATETVSRIEGSIWAPSIHPKQPKTSPFALPFTPFKC